MWPWFGHSVSWYGHSASLLYPWCVPNVALVWPLCGPHAHGLVIAWFCCGNSQPWCGPGVALVCPYCVSGMSLVCPWCVPGVFLVCPWCVSGVHLVCPWCAPGVPLVYPRCVPGVSLVCPWWFAVCPWPSQTVSLTLEMHHQGSEAYCRHLDCNLQTGLTILRKPVPRHWRGLLQGLPHTGEDLDTQITRGDTSYKQYYPIISDVYCLCQCLTLGGEIPILRRSSKSS